MSSHRQVKRQIREYFELCTGLKLNPVKMLGSRCADLYSLNDNCLVIMKYCTFLSGQSYRYFFGVQGELLHWMLTEWEKAEIWFILNDAEHVAFMDGIDIGRHLLESETSSCDSRGQYKIKVTEDYEMWLDSQNPMIDMKPYMLPKDEQEGTDFLQIRYR